MFEANTGGHDYYGYPFEFLLRINQSNRLKATRGSDGLMFCRKEASAWTCATRSAICAKESDFWHSFIRLLKATAEAQNSRTKTTRNSPKTKKYPRHWSYEKPIFWSRPALRQGKSVQFETSDSGAGPSSMAQQRVGSGKSKPRNARAFRSVNHLLKVSWTRTLENCSSILDLV